MSDEKVLLSRSEYARRRGCSAEAIRKAVKSGKIILVNEKVDVAQADAALSKGSKNSEGADYWSEKTRHEKVKADLAEIELAEKQKEVVGVQEVVEKVERIFTTIRQKILAMPTKATPLIMAEDGELGVKLQLESCCHEVLSELSSYVESGDWIRSGSDKKRTNAKATTKAKRKRVGTKRKNSKL